jgi:peptide/nickel transport system substrate-binding protein
MKKTLRKLVLAVATVVTVTSFAGCNNTKSTSTGKSSGKAYAEPTVNKDKVMNMAGYWSKPPQFNGNFFNGDGNNVAQYFVYERLWTTLRVGTGKTYMQLADKVENKEDKTIVTLKKGIKWHDGEAFTSKDIWAFYMLRKVDTSKYLASIETPDENTLVFNWQKPAVFEEMRMELIAKDLNGTMPYHIYKELADKAAEIYKSAAPNTDTKKKPAFGVALNEAQTKAFADNNKNLVNLKMEKPIGTGPYKFSSVDDNNLVLVKNADYYDAKNVHFEKINFKMAPADISQYYAMLRNGEFDIDNGTPPKDVLESTLAANKDLVHYTMFDMASYGVMFNTRKAPFDNVKFRQAIAYIIDKGKVREVGNYYGKEFNKISAIGFPPSMMEKVLDKNMKLTDYTKNEEKAASLLKELGWTKGSNGQWADSTGKKAEFIIGSDAGFDITLNSAQVVAEQLTKFGINTQVKAVDGSVFYTNARAGEYDMTCYLMDMNWGMKDAWDGLNNAYVGLKDYMGLPNNLTAKGYDGSEVDVYSLIDQYPRTQDAKEREKIISNLAYVYNENCYAVNLFQTSYGVFINMKNIDGNFPAAGDIEKYDRNMPLYTDNKDINDRIVELNYEFQCNRNWTSGEFWPK